MKNDRMVFSRFNRPHTISTDFGNGERSIFEERIVDGQRSLVIVGKENFKDFIEASKEETLIENIIKRFQSGDVTALAKNQGFYADVIGMPNNLAEAQNMLISLEKHFNSLSAEDRALFDNSFDKYVSEVSRMDVDTFLEKFNLVKQEMKTDDLILEKDGVINEPKSE